MNTTEKISDLSDHILKVLGDITNELSELLPYSHVEHVGAMAVPIVGRQEIDMMVICFQDVNADAEVLAQHGYTRGATIDDVLFMSKGIDGVEVSVQIMKQGNSMIERHRQFKEKLQSDPALYKRLEDFKWTLDGLTKEEYKKRKDAWMKENFS
jgi:GrpB-like predicted nucleotidyltransferase (UPF0157 family)